jgi:sulfatase maturation enzyme AslB (radical SAM superfamily)
MSLDQTFCASPWFHTRINSNGDYEYCRWADTAQPSISTNIRNTSPGTWFQQHMRPLRQSMLDGQTISGCSNCTAMERNGKISGRQKQLLKVGVTTQNFQKTMLSSPWLPQFRQSLDQGITDQLPQDWQIDLGNFCNSACIFCGPANSSRLAQEFVKIGLLDSAVSGSWCDQPDLLQRFLDTLKQTKTLRYLHFIGGETLITPAFRIILEKMIDQGLNKDVTVGFTTNLTVWNQPVFDLLCQFPNVNLGMSIECVHQLNDYVRYGSNIKDVMAILHRWIQHARSLSWLMQIRTTPTMLSIWHLDTIYEFARQNAIAVESCNFLDRPEFLRISVLPKAWRHKVAAKMQAWIDQHGVHALDPVINIRDPNRAHAQIIQDAASYVTYLDSEPDESHRLPDLVRYLKLLESNRGNSVLHYLPEYEELLRSAGY